MNGQRIIAEVFRLNESDIDRNNLHIGSIQIANGATMSTFNAINYDFRGLAGHNSRLSQKMERYSYVLQSCRTPIHCMHLLKI